MKFKQLRINSTRELLVYPAKSKSAQRKTMVAKEKPSAPQKTMSREGGKRNALTDVCDM